MSNPPGSDPSLNHFMHHFANLAQQAPSPPLPEVDPLAALNVAAIAIPVATPPGADADLSSAATSDGAALPPIAAVTVAAAVPVASPAPPPRVMMTNTIGAKLDAADIARGMEGLETTAAAPAQPPQPTMGKAATAVELEIGLRGLPGTDGPAPAMPAKPRRQVRFVEAERERLVMLAHPLECDGFVYDRIAVRRLTVTDYREHFAKPQEDRGPFPCFFDQRGEPVPVEVLDALSFDDGGKVNEAYDHFLPASFRADPEP